MAALAYAPASSYLFAVQFCPSSELFHRDRSEHYKFAALLWPTRPSAPPLALHGQHPVNQDYGRLENNLMVLTAIKYWIMQATEPQYGNAESL